MRDLVFYKSIDITFNLETLISTLDSTLLKGFNLLIKK